MAAWAEDAAAAAAFRFCHPAAHSFVLNFVVFSIFQGHKQPRLMTSVAHSS